MSSDSKIVKPKTDFQLVLNYSNQCIWKSESGAGANAASGVDMTFPSTTEPLSEIVWSPSKGFSLSCVDSSFAEEKTSLYRDVEPSSMVLALLQSVTGGMSTTGETIDDVFVKPVAVICANSDISPSVSPTRNPTSDSDGIIQDFKSHEEHYDTGSGGNMKKINTARGEPNLPNDEAKAKTAIISKIKGNKCSTVSGHVDHRPVDIHQADKPQPCNEQNPSPRKHSNGGMDINFGNQVVVIKGGLYTKVEHINEYEGSDALKSSSRSPLEKLESGAENNLHTFNRETTCAEKSGVLVSKSKKNKNKCQGNEMVLICDKNLPVMNSPSNSKIPMARDMGKEKYLSDMDASASLSKEENDSRVSVESCYSAEMFSLGKKRCSFQQQLIVGIKKLKKHIQETSQSKSYVQQDSSFMNLISNMRKGFSQDESKPLAHTIANPDHHLLLPDPKPTTCNKNQDPAPQNTGSKSNFQSAYCPSLKNVATRNSHQVGEASKDFELSNKVHGIDVTPITTCAENNSLYKQYFQSNKFEISTRSYDVSPSSQPKIRPKNLLNSHENRKNDSVKTKSCYHMEISKDKEGMTLHSSSNRQNKNNYDNLESYVLSERKATNNIFHESHMEGLWISRFFPKSTTPLMICDHINEKGESQLHSTDSSMLLHSHKRVTYLNNCKIEETREQSANNLLFTKAKKLQNCCVNKKASTGLKGNNDHISRHNLSPITPFPGFSDSEAMAPMFARRLGTIKHMPTNRTDSIPHRKTSTVVVHHLSSWS